jgi:hypothetical protein
MRNANEARSGDDHEKFRWLGLLVPSAPAPLWVNDPDETLRKNLTAAYAASGSGNDAMLQTDGVDVVGFLTGK